MRPENQVRLARIKKISAILRGACKAFLAFCVLGFLRSARSLVIPPRTSFPGGGHAIYWEGFYGVSFQVAPLTDRDRAVAGVILALTWGAVFYCGYQLHRLLGNYSRGEVFTTESAAQIRRWGISCVMWGVTQLGWMLVPFVTVNAHRQQWGEGLGLVVNGLAIVAISWFMEMATEMREEQDLII